MRVLPFLAATTFVAGLAMLIVGYTYSQSAGHHVVAARVTPIPIALSPTPSPTDAPSPTPTPYNGTPVRFVIPSQNVSASVESIGIDRATNQLEVPKNPRDVGWYDIYTKPGFVGNAIFSGHVDYYGLDPNLMPFHQLANLKPGDEIDIVMDNGLTYKYQFIGRYVYDINSIPMGDIISGKFADPAGKAPTVEMPPGAQWITLITCDNGGPFVYVNGGNSGPVEYLQRTVVVAQRVQ